MKNIYIILFVLLILYIFLRINKISNEKLENEILINQLNSYKLIYKNEKDEQINHLSEELNEQLLVEKYIQPNDVVLELGARYGTVTCIINKKLNNKNHLISVEPDSTVWSALERNLSLNNCNSTIVKGFISNKPLSLSRYGYGSTQADDPNSKIPNYTLEDIKKNYNIPNFTALIVDCEGCMESFLNENPNILLPLRLVMFEKDYANKCNYDNIKSKLTQNNFKQVENGFHEVWIKNN